MGNRYEITGVQIGMIWAFLDLKEYDKIRELLQSILDKKKGDKN